MNIDPGNNRFRSIITREAVRRAVKLVGGGLASALLVLILFVVLILPSCQRDEQDYSTMIFSLDAFCTVNVQGIGEIDIETDYLPHVVHCENGGAGPESLKAQAVAARSVTYYKIQTSGYVLDSTDDQVYSCDSSPTSDDYNAVNATSGQVLMYNGVVVCAFYVAGAEPSNSTTCVATASDIDHGGSEHNVTYNEGLSGSNIEQTTLGWVDPSNDRNRGCLSQWGSRCLEEAGYGYQDILRFYYGEDIGFETAVGSCVVNPCTPSAEVCNGLDDDCDGQIDEDYVPYTCGEGICQAQSTCSGGVESCTPALPEGSEGTCEGEAEDAASDGEEAQDTPPAFDGYGDTEGEDGTYPEGGMEGSCGCSVPGIDGKI